MHIYGNEGQQKHTIDSIMLPRDSVAECSRDGDAEKPRTRVSLTEANPL